MTSLRDKAREIKAAGAAERDDYTPDGAPKRFYSYWLERSDSKRAVAIKDGTRTENFCHFWRVVAIWAPLMFLNGIVKKAFPFLAGALVLGAIAVFVWALFSSGDVRGVVGIVLAVIAGAAYVGIGLVSGISAAYSADERDTDSMITNKYVLGSVFVLTLPIALVVFGVTKLSRNWDTDWDNYAKLITLGIAVAFFLTFYVISWITNPFETLIGTLGTVGVIVAVGGLMIGASFLEDYIKGRRKIAKNKRAAELEAYYAEHGEYPWETAKAQPPSKLYLALAGFFSGIGDFVILIAQVVRVNKWKICPTVSITND